MRLICYWKNVCYYPPPLPLNVAGFQMTENLPGGPPNKNPGYAVGHQIDVANRLPEITGELGNCPSFESAVVGNHDLHPQWMLNQLSMLFKCHVVIFYIMLVGHCHTQLWSPRQQPVTEKAWDKSQFDNWWGVMRPSVPHTRWHVSHKGLNMSSHQADNEDGTTNEVVNEWPVIHVMSCNMA